MEDKYSPKEYWDKRANLAKESIYQAVCRYGISDIENKAMEKIQVSIFEEMIKSVNLKETKVMELGCGVGRWPPFILKQGAFYTGVDISEKMIKIAKERIPQGDFCLIDLNQSQLPFPENYFDFVFSITVLHHNFYQDQEKLIEEMIRVTKKNGFILLLEALAKKKERIYFNTFARPIEDWIFLVTKRERAKLLKMKVFRYYILRDGVFKVLRRLGIGKINFINNFLVVLDGYLDKWLFYFLPSKFAQAFCALFKKL